MRKRGASHIEIIIAFVIFISFLVFMYVIIEPILKTPSGKESTLSSLRERVLDYLSADITTYSLNVVKDIQNPQGCVLVDTSSINPEDLVARVKAVEGGGSWELGNYHFNPETNKLSLYYDPESDTSYNIYYSDIFYYNGYGDICTEDELAECGAQGEGDACFETNYIDRENVVYTENINDLVEITYPKPDNDEEWNIIRGELGIPVNNYFWFSFEDQDGNLLEPAQPTIAEEIEVYSETIPVDYVNEDIDLDNKLKGFLTIKIW